MSACPVCDAELRRTHHDWVLSCPQCGHLASTLEAAIEQPIAEGRIDEERRASALTALRRKNFDLILDRLAALGSHGSVLLDVGCAHGWFLDAAAKRGYAVHGIEPDGRVAARTAQRGHAVVVGLFPDALPAGARYDVIAFNDVFEHVHDPVHVLAACHDRLYPEGLLVINLPSSHGVFFRVASALDRIGVHGPYERLWQKGFPSPHRSYFHPDGLVRLVERHGFREAYRGTLVSTQREGLWQRLRFDTSAPVIASAALWVGICLAAPLLQRLPADISLHIFRRAAAETAPWIQS
jgi:2-polyprenyl-3-methyl-5-hydroxy-6-metoxy-1,4-benzoquinol methylase